MSASRVLRYAEHRTRRGALTIPTIAEVAADPSCFDRFLVAFERVEAARATEPDEVDGHALIVSEAYMGVSVLEDAVRLEPTVCPAFVDAGDYPDHDACFDCGATSKAHDVERGRRSTRALRAALDEGTLG